MSNTINTSECEFCKYGTVDDSNKARVMVNCEYKGKTFYYGQSILCEEFKKSKEKE